MAPSSLVFDAILIILSFICTRTCSSERVSVHSREFPQSLIALIWFIRISSAHRCTISFSFMFIKHNYSHCLRRKPPPPPQNHIFIFPLTHKWNNFAASKNSSDLQERAS